MNAEKSKTIIEEHAAQLMEHFDTVQIFCTQYDSVSGKTTVLNTGAGNFFARLGQVNEWKAFQEEGAREDMRTQMKSQDDL